MALEPPNSARIKMEGNKVPRRASLFSSLVEEDRQRRAQSTPRQRGTDKMPRLSSASDRDVNSIVSPFIGKRQRQGLPGHSSPHARRRMVLRPSLLGSPQIREMDLQKKADLLSDIAGDFILRITGGISRPESAKEWRNSWNTLQTLRHSDIFPPNNLLFPMVQNVLYQLPAGEIYSQSHLERAVRLTNLATFCFVIFRPDEASSLLEYMSLENDTASALRIKAAQDAMALHGKVECRNKALLTAWKCFWRVLVSPDRPIDPKVFDLWVDFSTQFCLTYQSPTVHPPSDAIAELPPLPDHLAEMLFHQQSIALYKQEDPDQSLVEDSDPEVLKALDKKYVHERWSEVANARRDEIQDTHWSDLCERYPYSDFAANVAVYVQSQISGSGVGLVHWGSPSSDMTLSPGRLPAILHPIHSPSKLRDSSVSRLEPPSEHPGLFHLDADERTEISEDANSLVPRGDIHRSSSPALGNMVRDLPIDMDLMKEMAMELDADFVASQADQGAESGNDLSVNADGELGIRSSATPRRVVAHSTSIFGKFNFASKQKDAKQVGWEESPMVTSRIGQTLHTHRGTAVTPRQTRQSTDLRTRQQASLTSQTLGSQTRQSHLNPGAGALGLLADGAPYQNRQDSPAEFLAEDVLPGESQFDDAEDGPGGEMDDAGEYLVEDILPVASQTQMTWRTSCRQPVNSKRIHGGFTGMVEIGQRRKLWIEA
ncbi:hypothetical protein BD324DRAFT_81440 [Kockovaella imperatae]|uniref:Uncharacterized protein n=1 Tax=Kockovaella imperatae TaxID=4999 RepID=A0A1Y1UAZ6_9TREE|nr:hypothetical protein BD324DRAFT_81440 [Kockovaella imperatae]ORX35211.1 hypothetical protein BD324DRAFT_81440 [Kockovaella imperatae]